MAYFARFAALPPRDRAFGPVPARRRLSAPPALLRPAPPVRASAASPARRFCPLSSQV